MIILPQCSHGNIFFVFNFSIKFRGSSTLQPPQNTSSRFTYTGKIPFSFISLYFSYFSLSSTFGSNSLIFFSTSAIFGATSFRFCSILALIFAERSLCSIGCCRESRIGSEVRHYDRTYIGSG